MSYKKTGHIIIVNPKDGYDKVSDKYGKYHDYLSSFDNNIFVRFLPRNLQELKVLEIGAGDGRIYKVLPQKPKFFVACDISQNLLKKHPKVYKKIICDFENDDILENKFGNGYFDIILAFFVLEHIQDLDVFFQKIYNLLSDKGILIFNYYPQRKERLRGKGKNKFKIQNFKHTLNEVKSYGEKYFDVKFIPQFDEGKIIGGVFVSKKI